MAVTHSHYHENPNPTAEYRSYWKVLNQRTISVQEQGYAITTNLVKAIMLDCERYLKTNRSNKGLGVVIGELEARGIEGIPAKYLKQRRVAETANDAMAANKVTN